MGARQQYRMTRAELRGHKDPQADVFKLVHDWLRNKKNGRRQSVLNNADHVGVLSRLPSNGQAWLENNGARSTWGKCTPVQTAM